MHRALRFTLPRTKLVRDAQLSRESKTRLICFKRKMKHQRSTQYAAHWTKHLLKEGTN
jgi:hypothetical protein